MVVRGGLRPLKCSRTASRTLTSTSRQRPWNEFHPESMFANDHHEVLQTPDYEGAVSSDACAQGDGSCFFLPSARLLAGMPLGCPFPTTAPLWWSLPHRTLRGAVQLLVEPLSAICQAARSWPREVLSWFATTNSVSSEAFLRARCRVLRTELCLKILGPHVASHLLDTSRLAGLAVRVQDTSGLFVRLNQGILGILGQLPTRHIEKRLCC